MDPVDPRTAIFFILFLPHFSDRGLKALQDMPYILLFSLKGALQDSI